MFDTDALISQSTKTEGALFVPQPDEADYRALIDNSTPVKEWFRPLEVTNKETGEKEPRMILRIPFLLQDPALQKKLERDRIIISMDCWIDFTADGRIDFDTAGKNTKLHRVRAAVGQNKKGKEWNISMLPGAGPLMVHVSKRDNPKDSTNPFTEIDRVAPLG